MTSGKTPAKKPRSQSFTPPSSFTEEIRDGDLDKPMELTDFMFQLGFHYKLPEKKGIDLSVAIMNAVRTRLWIPVVALTIILAFAVARFRVVTPPTVPRELWGEWRTGERRYAGRGFTFNQGYVTLQFGDTLASRAQRVLSVSADTLLDGTQYTVLYRNDGGGLTKFAFAYLEDSRPTIILPNPVNVAWLRASDSGYVAAPTAMPQDR